MEETAIRREINIDRLEGRYKCISAYEIPEYPSEWLECPKCGLRPLVWEFNNGRSTACGCGENEYRHFSIYAESIMSYVTRNGGSAAGYETYELRNNWNRWVLTGEERTTHQWLRDNGRW